MGETMRTKCSVLCQLAGAAALVLALTLTACGQTDAGDTDQEAAKQEATEEAAGAEAEESTLGESAFEELNTEIPELATKITAATRAVAADPQSAEAVDVESLPQSETDPLAVEREDEIANSDGDTSKAPTGLAWLSYGGIEMLVPTNWFVKHGVDGLDIMSADGMVSGYLGAIRKTAGYSYDVTAMASSIPQVLQRDYGATDIQVLAFDSLYSERGTLCDTYIQLGCMIDGQAAIYYCEYVESKSYISFLSLAATPDDWQKNWENGLYHVINSVRFAANEEI